MNTLPDNEMMKRLEAQLFRSMAADEPSPRARMAIAAAMRLTLLPTASVATAGSVAANAAGTVLGTSKTGVLPAVILKWFVVGAMTGTAAIGVSSALLPHSTSDPTNNLEPPASGAKQRGVASRKPSRTPTGTTAKFSPNAQTSAGATARPPAETVLAGRRWEPESSGDAASAVTATGLQESSATSRLRMEVELLDQVRSALSRNDGGHAASLLDHYRQTFPHKTLTLEADVLRIESLVSAESSG